MYELPRGFGAAKGFHLIQQIIVVWTGGQVAKYKCAAELRVKLGATNMQ